MQTNFSHIFNRWLDTLGFLPENKCSYYPDRTSRVKAFIASPQIPMTGDIIDSLMSQGFRRSGNIFYQNDCPACDCCISYRLDLKKFKISKSQQRILKKNRDLHILINKPMPTGRKKNIYLRYQYLKHYNKPSFPGGPRKEFDFINNLSIMMEQMYENALSCLEMEVFLGEKIIGFSIMDLGLVGASMVYLVFDPKFEKRSIGKYIILKTIEWALTEGYKYLYLGFYIPQHTKMDYKSQFGPGERLNPYIFKWGPF